ncbi:uncharacterized protein DS421_1g32140 [Arachis hypogaea]|nr:uncharacterized protein DS421_1g32140 [Arachis hypogaea]
MHLARLPLHFYLAIVVRNFKNLILFFISSLILSLYLEVLKYCDFDTLEKAQAQSLVGF